MSTPAENPNTGHPNPAAGQGSTHGIEAQDTGNMPNLEADIKRIRTSETRGIIRLSKPLDDTNWSVWHDCMLNIFKIYGAEEYVTSNVT